MDLVLDRDSRLLFRTARNGPLLICLLRAHYRPNESAHGPVRDCNLARREHCYATLEFGAFASVQNGTVGSVNAMEATGHEAGSEEIGRKVYA